MISSPRLSERCDVSVDEVFRDCHRLFLRFNFERVGSRTIGAERLPGIVRIICAPMT